MCRHDSDQACVGTRKLRPELGIDLNPVQALGITLEILVMQVVNIRAYTRCDAILVMTPAVVGFGRKADGHPGPGGPKEGRRSPGPGWAEGRHRAQVGRIAGSLSRV